MYIGDSEHFNKVSAMETDSLYIATPVRGRVSGKWTILMSRQMRAADGSFAGAILGAIGALGGFLGVILGGRLSVHLRRSNPSGRLKRTVTGARAA